MTPDAHDLHRVIAASVRGLQETARLERQAGPVRAAPLERLIFSTRVTYDELRKDLVEHYQATGDRDLEEAGWRLKHLDRAFRGARANLITAAAITRYIVQRQGEQAANGTTNREVAVLLRMLRLGLERGKVARVPIVHKPKEAAPRAGFFEADAFAAVRAHLPADLQVAVTVARRGSSTWPPAPSDSIRGAPRTTRGAWSTSRRSSPRS